MASNTLWDWFLGRTPKMKERRERTLRHPVRSAIVAGAGFGGLMSVYYVRQFGPNGVIVGVISGAAFGPLLVWSIRRRERKGRGR